MNQQQRKYAVGRIKDITFKKSNDIRTEMYESHEWIGDIPVNKEFMIKLIRDEKVKLKSDQVIKNMARHNRVLIHEIFNFTTYFETMKVYKLSVEARIKNLETESQRIQDEIMYSDLKESINIINEHIKTIENL